MSGASFQHNLSMDQYSSGDSNSLADSQKVMRRMLPGSPGVPRQAKSADFKEKLQKHKKVAICKFFVQK